MATDKIVNNKIAVGEVLPPPAPHGRRRRSPAASQDNILAAAEEILTSQGPHHLKLAEVAAQAGVATATVLHHFGSIDDMQSALMERMVTHLAGRVVAIAAAAPVGRPNSLATATALFDAFEERGAARLAAWLVLTGEAKRFEVVRRAVDAVVDLTLERLPNPPPREGVEDFVLVSITLALGAGLFGPTLSTQLDRKESSAREAALELLAARIREAGFG